MQRRRSIRTTNEGRSVQVREDKPQLAHAAPSAQIGKEVVDALNKVLPQPKQKTLQEMVEESQKKMLANPQIGKGVSKEWVDANFGGISKTAWLDYVNKFNLAMSGAMKPQPAAMLKPYSGQQYPLPTTVSPPPGYSFGGLNFNPPAPIDPQIFKSMATDIGGILAGIKIVVDPTLPQDMMVTLGVNGQPVLIQLQKQDVLELLKQHAEKP
jgi:hypothetical protein